MTASPDGAVSVARRADILGTVAAFATYGIWGLFPLYWKRLGGVDAIQILCHRIVWSAILTFLILAAKRGGLRSLLALARDAGKFARTALASILITANWGIYIMAVNSGRVSDSSLGYYINPLLSVALGAIFLGERMDRGTAWAIGIAGAGVAFAAIAAGSLPWVSLVLAATFGFYGLIKKKMALDPLLGLTAETMFAAPFALAWLVREQLMGRAAFANPANGGGAIETTMLVLAGIVTALPLFLFAFAAVRIPLQRLGFIQYISPSSQLALGVLVYGERPAPGRLVAFAAVAIAVLVYAGSRRSAATRPGGSP